MAKKTAFLETAQDLAEEAISVASVSASFCLHHAKSNNLLSLLQLLLELTSYAATSGANQLHISYSWSLSATKLLPKLLLTYLEIKFMRKTSNI